MGETRIHTDCWFREYKGSREYYRSLWNVAIQLGFVAKSSKVHYTVPSDQIFRWQKLVDFVHTSLSTRYIFCKIISICRIKTMWDTMMVTMAFWKSTDGDIWQSISSKEGKSVTRVSVLVRIKYCPPSCQCEGCVPTTCHHKGITVVSAAVITPFMGPLGKSTWLDGEGYWCKEIPDISKMGHLFLLMIKILFSWDCGDWVHTGTHIFTLCAHFNRAVLMHLSQDLLGHLFSKCVPFMCLTLSKCRGETPGFPPVRQKEQSGAWLEVPSITGFLFLGILLGHPRVGLPYCSCSFLSGTSAFSRTIYKLGPSGTSAFSRTICKLGPIDHRT